ncbi:hypothetical protein CFELI_09690 [Corynebacterium felinum]|nr:hypothetical protein CFELI_09690 [Corynebacterium felinum]
MVNPRRIFSRTSAIGVALTLALSTVCAPAATAFEDDIRVHVTMDSGEHQRCIFHVDPDTPESVAALGENVRGAATGALTDFSERIEFSREVIEDFAAHPDDPARVAQMNQRFSERGLSPEQVRALFDALQDVSRTSRASDAAIAQVAHERRQAVLAGVNTPQEAQARVLEQEEALGRWHATINGAGDDPLRGDKALVYATPLNRFRFEREEDAKRQSLEALKSCARNGGLSAQAPGSTEAQPIKPEVAAGIAIGAVALVATVALVSAHQSGHLR